jgi:hypothetical protein
MPALPQTPFEVLTAVLLTVKFFQYTGWVHNDTGAHPGRPESS